MKICPRLKRIARMTHEQTLSGGREIVVEMDMLNSQLVLEGTQRECLGDDTETLSPLKSFVFAVLGLCPCACDQRVAQLDLAIPGSEAWLTNQTGKPVTLLRNLIDHALSEGNPLGGLLVGMEYAVKRRNVYYRFIPVSYSALELPEPNIDAILAMAATPVEAPRPPPSPALSNENQASTCIGCGRSELRPRSRAFRNLM